MFTEETVLVLGAGSSVHHGYPTGDGLIKNIKDAITNHRIGQLYPDMTAQSFKRQMRHTGDYPSKPIEEISHEYKNLYEKLEFFDPLSIDSFLTAWNESEPDIVKAGKTLITYEILQKEKIKTFNSSYRPQDENGKPQRGNWYRFLWHALISPSADKKEILSVVDEIISNPKLKIITFNYDMSLDYYLSSRIKNATFLGNKSDALWNSVKENIIHIYGQVGGSERNIDDYGKYNQTYGSEIALCRTHIFSDCQDKWHKTIQVMGMERGNEDVETAAKTAKEWLSNAKKIYFLGYGFNEDNNDLLDLKNSCKYAEKIYITNYGDSPKIREISNSLFKKKSSRPNSAPSNPPRTPEELILSPNGVYQALEHDMPLNNYPRL